jgi:hypothetical protein
MIKVVEHIIIVIIEDKYCQVLKISVYLFGLQSEPFFFLPAKKSLGSVSNMPSKEKPEKTPVLG